MFFLPSKVPLRYQYHSKANVSANRRAAVWRIRVERLVRQSQISLLVPAILLEGKPEQTVGSCKRIRVAVWAIREGHTVRK